MLITAAMMLYYQVGVNWQFVMIIPIFIELALLAFGIGCFVMHIGVFLDDMTNIIDIVMRMLMYFVGIFYSIPRRFTAPWNVILVKWNPVALLIDSCRNILLYNQQLDYPMLIFWGVISLILAYAGVRIVIKNENTYVKVV